MRSLPAGLMLLAVRRQRPRGSWWWKAAVLGVLNTGGFLALVYVAAQLLPTGTASTIMAASPVAMMVIAWALVAERPGLLPLLGAAAGIGGVCLMLLTGTVGLVGLLNPVTGVLLGTVIAGESLTLRQTCGLVLVLGGILLGRPAARRRAAVVRRARAKAV